ncbi:uncharacterized protein LOC107177480 [Citrus sinensis]|uniref:uncharacterized protein LOC107177480 n=1 Tax=Citrus sinensis TaxID=2711 RepID=UPI000763AF96|nr:uncharacterized protein LOC107177480 [Citrus sinensis]XP_024038300.1 uncharacterized protein LOC112097346 [Citrus x clementina]
MMQRLEQMVREMGPLDDVTAKHEPQFASDIMVAKYPPRFHLPQMEPYDGQRDPTEHLELYRTLMEVQGASQAILYRAFPLTLVGAARRWFRKLQPHFISSFGDLSREFTSHFRSAQQRRKPVTYLLTVKQQEWETLRDYIRKYNNEIIQVDGYDDGISLFGIMEGLKMGKLWWSVSKRPPTSYSEMLARVEKYANAEERFKNRNQEK